MSVSRLNGPHREILLKSTAGLGREHRSEIHTDFGSDSGPATHCVTKCCEMRGMVPAGVVILETKGDVMVMGPARFVHT